MRIVAASQCRVHQAVGAWRLAASALLLGLLFFVVPALNANSLRIFTLNAEEWEQPRSGSVIRQMSALRAAVKYRDKVYDSALVIHYPGEDSGEIWATELRDWLVSLGIPVSSIRLVAGSISADELKIVVGKRAELEL